MVRLSRYKVNKTIMHRIFTLLLDVIGKHKNKDEFFSILFDIISPSEQLMIAKRIAAMYLIQKGMNYTIICDVLKISSASLAKYTLLLDRSKGIKQILEVLIQHNKVNLILRDIFISLNGPGSYGINWKTAQKIKREVEKEKIQGI